LVLLAFGTLPTLRFFGLLSDDAPNVTTQWDVVRVAPDRRSAVIRVDECAGGYDNTTVMRVGENVRLLVTVDDDVEGSVDCVPFDQMPTHIVNFGFTLPANGHVIASGCPKVECGDPDLP
jgi:hypothetical protein